MPHVDYVGLDGAHWPSVTELTRLLPDGWLWSWYKHSVEKDGWAGWQANKKKSEEGMAMGTLIHSEIEELIKCSGVAEASNEALAMYDAVAPGVDEWVAIEPHLICNDLRFAGTADMIVRQSYTPGLWVGDWKTSFHKSDSHPLQLAAYAMAWNETHEDQKINQGFIVRVDKKSDEYNVKIDEYQGLEKYYSVIRALRELWDYSEHQGVWIKSKKVKVAKGE